MTTPAQRAMIEAAGFRSIALPPSPCPDCGWVSDSVSRPADAGTIEDSWMVCAGCATPRVVGPGHVLRAVTRAEFEALPLPDRDQLGRMREVHRRLSDYRGTDGTWPPPVEG